MAAIQEVHVQAAADPAIVDGIKAALARALWGWFMPRRNNKLFTVSVWFISKTFYWRDLEPFLRLLLGPNPYTEPMSTRASDAFEQKKSRRGLFTIQWHIDDPQN